jgi:flavorubredoxin
MYWFFLVQVYDEDLEKLESHFRFYYDCLMRPNARSVLTALKRLNGKEFATIAVGHGPLLRYNVADLMQKYETWSKDAQEKKLTSAAVLYVSDYGFSDRLSQVCVYIYHTVVYCVGKSSEESTTVVVSYLYVAL